MSQSVKEFVRQSGVDVQNSDSNSNNNFAQELEADMFRRQREDRMRVAGFREPLRPELIQRPRRPLPRRPPLENEFSDVNINKLVNNALKEPIDTREFNNDLSPINEAAFERGLAEMTPEFDVLEISPFKPGMFNAIVDSGYGQKDLVVDLKQIITKRPLAKMRIADGLYIETSEMVGRYGRQAIALRHTRNLGLKGSMSIPLVTVEFKMKIYNENGESTGINVNIYKNGKIRFSGGFLISHMSTQPELVRRYVVNNYTSKEPFFYGPIQFNNLSGQFSVNGALKMGNIASKLKKYGSVVYEPELTPMMYVTMNGYTLNISKAGTVQIMGAKNPAILENAYKSISQMFRQFFINGDIVKSKPKAKPKAKPKQAQSKAQSKAQGSHQQPNQCT
jgi:TATA-box binding protein (TBP) (component of TFIID and TFIIIB)